MHDATRPAFGRVRAPKSRSVTRLLRTKLGRLGHHRPDNRVREEAGLSRDDLAPLRLARTRFGVHTAYVERREVPQIAGIPTGGFVPLRLMRDGFG